VNDILLQDLEAQTSWLLGVIPEVILALIVIAIALFIDERVQRAVERTVARRGGQPEIGRLLGRMARVAVLIVAAILVISVFGLYSILASFLASLGIAGLIIAFALQDITKNFAAGVLLVLLRPFRLHDRIKVRDFEGVVTDISLRATTLRTADGTEVLVPNADVYSSPITNYTRYAKRRYHVPLTLPAGVPVDLALGRLTAVLLELPGIERDPPLSLDASYWLPSIYPDAPAQMSQAITRLNDALVDLRARAAESA
jgi:small conductance mechanosensitive channel